MSPNYNRMYRKVDSRSHHSRRRRIKKVSTLLVLLGVICVLISVLIFANSVLQKSLTKKQRLEAFSAVYLAIGVVLVSIRGVLVFSQNRIEAKYLATRRQAKPYQPEPFVPLSAGNGLYANPAGKSNVPDTKQPSGGSVLVMVLVMIGLMALLVFQVQVTARGVLREKEDAHARLLLQQAATDATQNAVRLLAADEDLAVDSLDEDWAKPQEAVDPAGVSTRVTITDEDRRFNLNNMAAARGQGGQRAAEEVIMDILTLCGDFAPVEKVEALRDWIDSDAEGSRESSFYEDLPTSYAAANAPLGSWSEIFFVDGYSSDTFRRHERRIAYEAYSADLLDCVTVLPVGAAQVLPVNVNTASREVLLAILGLPYESVAASILALRDGEPLRDIGTLADALNPELFATIRPYLATNSRFFTIEAQAYFQGRSSQLRALAERTAQGDVRILQWVL
jgi:general secretion pathway protein K